MSCFHHHHQFYFRHLAHIHIKHIKTYGKTHTRNIQIVQIQVKLNKNSTISSCNYKHQIQLRAVNCRCSNIFFLNLCDYYALRY